ncbi:MAG TPA: DegT/DnrJ/EryC1/StrS family aminotransferase [Thermoplasmatales archaeon]|nr:DegT/DnrJ/EryC1/StrS family aminotransferase [Thermoplasmatales archaeon]
MEKLAIYGGKPVRKEPPAIEADVIEEEEIRAVEKVLRSGILRRGEVTREYEKNLAEYFGVKRALAVSNGTVSLQIALAAEDIGPGDEVITTAWSFIAPASAPLLQNAIPVFADIDPDYLTIDPEKIEEKVTERTKAIIPVPILGQPVDMGPILDLAEDKDLVIIEDAAQAHGAKYKNKLVGTHGDIGSFSTVHGKIMTTGEGGFLLTDDEEIYEKMWSFHNFSRRYGKGQNNQIHYHAPVTNYRITNVQSALAIEQLKKLDKFIAKRRENSEYLTKQIKDIEGIEPPKEAPWGKRVYWWYTIRINSKMLGITAKEFAECLDAEGVYHKEYYYACYPLPSHKQPFLVEKKGLGNTKCPFECPLYKGKVRYTEESYPNAEKASKEIFWLCNPHPLMKKEDLDDLAEAVRKVATYFYEKNK